jgi:hypothetical protein
MTARAATATPTRPCLGEVGGLPVWMTLMMGSKDLLKGSRGSLSCGDTCIRPGLPAVIGNLLELAST